MTAMIHRIAGTIPSPILAVILKLRDRRMLRVLSRSHNRRFYKYSAKGSRGNEQVQVESRLMFHAHSLEKGLSHTEFRPGFGQRALGQLKSALNDHVGQQFPLTSPAYLNALGVLTTYVNRHAEIGYDVSEIESYLGHLPRMQDAASPLSGGVVQIQQKTRSETTKANFADIFKHRTSVREFSSQEVTASQIEKAISITLKAPSICNRQGYRVRYYLEPDKIRNILRLQGGMTGYPTPPAVAAITVDLRTFLGANERNQAFIDGGIYAMSLLLALEYEAIAACPLNAMFSPKGERLMRAELDLPDYEVIIMFVALGHFPEKVLAPLSQRYGLDTILQDSK